VPPDGRFSYRATDDQTLILLLDHQLALSVNARLKLSYEAALELVREQKEAVCSLQCIFLTPGASRSKAGKSDGTNQGAHSPNSESCPTCTLSMQNCRSRYPKPMLHLAGKARVRKLHSCKGIHSLEDNRSFRLNEN